MHMLWWKLQQLKSSNEKTRAKAAKGLGAAKYRKAVPSLLRHLEDESQSVRMAVIQALGDIGHGASAEPMASALAALPRRPKSGGAEVDYASGAAGYEALAKALAGV